jgi:hypothetical protein
MSGAIPPPALHLHGVYGDKFIVLNVSHDLFQLHTSNCSDSYFSFVSGENLFVEHHVKIQFRGNSAVENGTRNRKIVGGKKIVYFISFGESSRIVKKFVQRQNYGTTGLQY